MLLLKLKLSLRSKVSNSAFFPGFRVPDLFAVCLGDVFDLRLNYIHRVFSPLFHLPCLVTYTVILFNSDSHLDLFNSNLIY